MKRVGPSPAERGKAGRCVERRPAARGFTLLEVLVAVAILALSLSSLLSSQMASMRATRYARGLTAAAYLAEYQLIEIEYLMNKEGWIENDKVYEGDFSEQGWPEVRYQCLVDFVELPEFNRLLEAKTDSEADEAEVGIEDAGDQAFSALGMVWPIAKGAIENSIRKANCKTMWNDGKVEHEFDVATFWAEAARLRTLPGLGGEVEDEAEGELPSGGAGVRPPSVGGRPGPSGRPGKQGGV